MNIKLKIQATNMRLTRAVREYVTQKVEQFKKVLPKDTDTEALIEVEVGKISRHHKTGDVMRAEINLTLKGKHFRAEASKDDIYKAIDGAKAAMQKELRRSKSKQESVRKAGAKKVKDIVRRARKR